ncbi:hypothetical protein EVAR_91706_1 [Eumeta japonica]|uniref:Uncharacterized protein n=1 Tax=Eumeta variegata TaxID=151549 RepID=A0A4C1SX52_EUMVA|nr:hypothetical protein EVAR_91706_1 [Eumeta japonica]
MAGYSPQARRRIESIPLRPATRRLRDCKDDDISNSFRRRVAFARDKRAFMCSVSRFHCHVSEYLSRRKRSVGRTHRPARPRGRPDVLTLVPIEASSARARRQCLLERSTPDAESLDFQSPFLPILPSARNFDTARDLGDNGQPRRTHASAPYNLNLHAHKYPESLVRTWKKPRRCSTLRSIAPAPVSIHHNKLSASSSPARYMARSFAVATFILRKISTDVHMGPCIAARGRPIIVEWERDARHSAGLSLVR